MTALEILRPGPLATVQDLGRPGLASLGVGQSGAADVAGFRLANRLVGNPESAAAVEATFGGLAVRARRDLVVAVTGAPCPMTLDGLDAAHNAVLRLKEGQVLELGPPQTGLRSYLSVRGGVDVEPVLGSRSSDVLSGIGPPALEPEDLLPVGPTPDQQPTVEVAAVPLPVGGDVELRVVLGPRADWFTDAAVEALLTQPFEVTSESNRIGARLAGPELGRRRDEELPSEGMVCGSVQVPPSGQPTLFLADHPVTGGYPVIAVVTSADVAAAAQARPGQRVRFRRDPARST